MDHSSTEAFHPASAGLHNLPARAVLTALLEAQIAAVSALHGVLPALELAAHVATQSLRAGGRLGYAGAGSSGLMAMADCLELAGTFGLPPEATPMMMAGGADSLLHLRGGVEDDPALALADLDRAGLVAGDALLCLSASGRTPYALAIARAAKARQVAVIGLANVAGSPLLEIADIPVLIETGAEVVSGSTRMGAATAQKVALNMLSVLIGLRLGHVHDGYMVNVVADNLKLMDRAARIVAAIAGVDRAAAETALSQSDGQVKTASLVARGMNTADARRALERSDGHLAPNL
jgi:N-acetylmuramic acid 6-phosphate etherase